MTVAVKEFFEHGRMYMVVSCTLVTLVPKHDETKTIPEYRPIAGCTTLYKIISKILTMRLSKVMQDIVGRSQAAFVPGQQIHNHILLAYELIKGYSRQGDTPRCMIQLDLQKAYDMVDWRALESILNEIGLPMKFVNWIMLVVSTVSYKFNVNGNYNDIMKAQRGVRQGDPISPYLFVIIMEYLDRVLYKMQRNPDYNHHAKCEKLSITHLTFADDILLFSRGDTISVEIMMEAVNKFTKSTGLMLNATKSRIYFGGVDNGTKAEILQKKIICGRITPIQILGCSSHNKVTLY